MNSRTKLNLKKEIICDINNIKLIKFSLKNNVSICSIHHALSENVKIFAKLYFIIRDTAILKVKCVRNLVCILCVNSFIVIF